ncbi:hypothetical protein Taro_032927 [Colocasia esculenta]|uniref:Uncharacterized protein n=1 Tax=Colocasia esculenta TaxID=4460 RepID=A0A843VMJ1_COLES|nr:hypothetical protein [Colocasia esculenta]
METIDYWGFGGDPDEGFRIRVCACEGDKSERRDSVATLDLPSVAARLRGSAVLFVRVSGWCREPVHVARRQVRQVVIL